MNLVHGNVEKLAKIAGIADHRKVVNAGESDLVDYETKLKLLQAMDLLPAQAEGQSEMDYNILLDEKALEQYMKLDEQRFNPPMLVVRQNNNAGIEIPVVEGDNRPMYWRINAKDENGQDIVLSGKIDNPNDLPIPKYRDEEYNSEGAEKKLTRDGVTMAKRLFPTPEGIPFGYHELSFGHDPDLKDAKPIQLAFAPEKCYDPIDIEHGGKTWGVPVQLYEQRSPEDQGMGDFSSLAEIANTVGRAGGGILGCNPLHAMFHDKPEEASPYAPASRTYANFLYNDVTAIPDFAGSAAEKLYDSPDYDAKRRKAQESSNVDYTTVAELKMPIMEACFKQFSQKEVGTERGKAFESFCEKGGKDLKNFAIFQALSAEMAQIAKGTPIDWRDWPAEFKNPNSPAVQAFADANPEKVKFYQYLQWETDRQMKNVADVCKDAGMKVGLYTDMAVGSAKFGYEAWGRQDVYMKASAGATPDCLSTQGQNWDIMGFKPQALRQEGYKAFTDMLESNMKNAGCTRLDHVLQLQRLYMIPDGNETKNGAWVYYPVQDLMGLVALESHRNKCMTIGENLGEIPPGFNDMMEKHGILSYKVLPFEREWGFQNGDLSGERNSFHNPAGYPKYSVCAPSTHDTPSLISQWNARDVHLKKAIGFYDTGKFEKDENGNDKLDENGRKIPIIDERKLNEEFSQCTTFRNNMNWELNVTGSYGRVGGTAAQYPQDGPDRTGHVDANGNPTRMDETMFLPHKFEEAVADFMGRGNSAIMLYPFTDMYKGLSHGAYMGNIPGTRQSHTSDNPNVQKIAEEGGASVIPWKNWRTKMTLSTNEIADSKKFNTIAGILNEAGRTTGNTQEHVGEKEPFKRPGRTEQHTRTLAADWVEKEFVQMLLSDVKKGYTEIKDIFKNKSKMMDRTEKDKSQYDESRKNMPAIRAKIEMNMKNYLQQSKKPPSIPSADLLKAKRAGGRG